MDAFLLIKTFRPVFLNPIPTHVYCLDTENIGKLNEFTSGVHFVTPRRNKLVIFPSYLSHYVEPSNSLNDRISIAFNSSI